jgi:hypothetical protein
LGPRSRVRIQPLILVEREIDGKSVATVVEQVKTNLTQAKPT